MHVLNTRDGPGGAMWPGPCSFHHRRTRGDGKNKMVRPVVPESSIKREQSSLFTPGAKSWGKLREIVGKLRENCGAVTKPPEASRSNICTGDTPGTNKHARWASKKQFAENLQKIAKSCEKVRTSTPPPPPASLGTHWRLPTAVRSQPTAAMGQPTATDGGWTERSKNKIES